jgi:hypothetical protein
MSTVEKVAAQNAEVDPLDVDSEDVPAVRAGDDRPRIPRITREREALAACWTTSPTVEMKRRGLTDEAGLSATATVPGARP